MRVMEEGIIYVCDHAFPHAGASGKILKGDIVAHDDEAPLKYRLCCREYRLAGAQEIIVEILGMHGTVDGIAPCALPDRVQGMGGAGYQGGAGGRALAFLHPAFQPELIVIAAYVLADEMGEYVLSFRRHIENLLLV